MKAITSKPTEVLEPDAVFTAEEWEQRTVTYPLRDNSRHEYIFDNMRYTEEYLEFMKKHNYPHYKRFDRRRR